MALELDVRTIGNKQVEIMDRLRQAEDRIDALAERLRKYEVRTEALERTLARRPSRP